MTKANRRAFLGGLAFAAGSLAATRASAVGDDGHAAGYDVSAADYDRAAFDMIKSTLHHTPNFDCRLSVTRKTAAIASSNTRGESYGRNVIC